MDYLTIKSKLWDCIKHAKNATMYVPGLLTAESLKDPKKCEQLTLEELEKLMEHLDALEQLYKETAERIADSYATLDELASAKRFKNNDEE